MRAMSAPEQSPLGRTVAFPAEYDPGLLFPIPRATGRAAIGLEGELPFTGVDVWNAYELSWLDSRGKPRVALAELRVPAASSHLIESKSLKLYLGSYAQTRIAEPGGLRAQLVRALSQAAGGQVGVVLTPAASANAARIEMLEGELIDDLPLAISHYGPPQPDLLSADAELRADEVLASHLLKSNCPVTAHTDGPSVHIRHTRPRMARDVRPR